MLPYAELHDAVGVLPSGTRGGPYLTPRPGRRPQITAVPNYYEREQPGANFDKLILFRRTMHKVSPDWSNKYHMTELSSPIGPYLHCPLE